MPFANRSSHRFAKAIDDEYLKRGARLRLEGHQTVKEVLLSVY
jgi:hypothetical protein